MRYRSEESARRAILGWECRDRPPRRSVGKGACVFACGYGPTPGQGYIHWKKILFFFVRRVWLLEDKMGDEMEMLIGRDVPAKVGQRVVMAASMKHDKVIN